MNKENNTLVSVIMPFFNTEQYIEEAITGILQQTYHNFEFIIINDASTDNSKKIVGQFNDKRIIYLENHEQKGIPYCMNLGIEIAKGKYIARMDSDDIVYPKRFDVQVDFLERNKHIDITGTSHKISNEKEIREILTDPNELKVAFLFYQAILNPSIMIRAESIRKRHIKHNETFIYASDYDFFISALINGLLLSNIPVCLMEYRRHQRQISTAHHHEQNEFADKTRKRFYTFLWGEDLTDDEINIFSKLKDYTTLSLTQYTNILEKILSINQLKKQFDNTLLIKHFVKRALHFCERQHHKNIFNKIRNAYQNPFIGKYASQKQMFDFAKTLLIISTKQTVKKSLGIKPKKALYG